MALTEVALALLSVTLALSPRGTSALGGNHSDALSVSDPKTESLCPEFSSFGIQSASIDLGNFLELENSGNSKRPVTAGVYGSVRESAWAETEAECAALAEAYTCPFSATFFKGGTPSDPKFDRAFYVYIPKSESELTLLLACV